MQKLEQKELFAIQGGALKLSAALLNAFSRAIGTILDLGRTVGTSIRMAIDKKIC